MDEPAFSLGIEEEYLLVDRQTRALAAAPAALMAECRDRLGEQVSPEFLRCQIEIGTRPCRTIRDARDDLRRLRTVVAEAAARHGLAPIAAGCHPFSDWKDQSRTPKDRYDRLAAEMQAIARRMLICGMHVHVGIGHDETRIDLMAQATWFLPHLLALSGSSPFWQGQDTGLASYRIGVFDNMPRTGLPPRFASWADYRRTVDLLVDLGVLEDATKIWWDLRPSDRFPTLESRICDVQPRMDDALALAALTQCLMRMLWRLSRKNRRGPIPDPLLVAENRWRARRHGTSAGLIDLARGRIEPVADLVEDLAARLAEDADVLGCGDWIARARAMAVAGPSAERQRAVHAAAVAAGADGGAAVVDHLITEFEAGL